MRPRPSFSAACWPLWLLVAAWACANLPETAPAQLLTWVQGAGRFGHNATLRQSVARLLASPAPASPRLADAPDAPVRHPLPAPLSAPTGLKKIEFGPATERCRLIAALPPVTWPSLALRPPAGPVRTVPHPPPRASRLA